MKKKPNKPSLTQRHFPIILAHMLMGTLRGDAQLARCSVRPTLPSQPDHICSARSHAPSAWFHSTSPCPNTSGPGSD